MITALECIKNEVVCLTDIKETFDVNFYRKTVYANSRGNNFYIPLTNKTVEDSEVILSSKKVGVVYVKDNGNGYYKITRLTYIGNKVYIIKYKVTRDVLDLLISFAND